MTTKNDSADNGQFTLSSVQLSTRLSIDIRYFPLALLSFMAIFGNILVILSVLVERRLRSTATNRFVASLAVSDLLMGALVMPFALYIKVNNNAWNLGEGLCKFHLGTTMFATTASILNLVAISIDRYFAIIFPTEYQRHAGQTLSAPYVTLVWIISGAVCIPLFLEDINLKTGSCWIEDPQYLVMFSLLSFFIPATIITYLYARIFTRIRQHLSLFWASGRNSKKSILPEVIVEEVRSRRGSRNSQAGTPQSRKNSGVDLPLFPQQANRGRSVSTAMSLVVPVMGDGSSQQTNKGQQHTTMTTATSMATNRDDGHRRQSSCSTVTIGNVSLHVPTPAVLRQKLAIVQRQVEQRLAVPEQDCSSLVIKLQGELDNDESTTRGVVTNTSLKRAHLPHQLSSIPLPPPSPSLSTTSSPFQHFLRPPKLPQIEQLNSPVSDPPSRRISFNNCSMKKDARSLSKNGSSISGVSSPGTLSSRTSQSSDERKSSMFSYGSSIDDDFDLASYTSSRKGSAMTAVSSDDMDRKKTKKNSTSSTVLQSGGLKLRQIAQQMTRAVRRKRRESRAIRRETRATRVVAAILIVFVACWLPYFCALVYRALRPLSRTPSLSRSRSSVDFEVYMITAWLGYAHSCFNCVIYTCLNRVFRSTFKRLLYFWLWWPRSSTITTKTCCGNRRKMT